MRQESVRATLLFLTALFVAGLGGCGRILVFVPYYQDLKPEQSAPPQACAVDATAEEIASGAVVVQKILARADELRDQVMEPLRDPPPVMLSSGTLETAVRDIRRRLQEELNVRYALWKHAQACYRRALVDDPSLFYAHLSMAAMAMRMADITFSKEDRAEYYTYAQNELGRARELRGNDGQLLYYQSELQVRRGLWADATQTLRTLIDFGWKRASVHNLLGYVYHRTDRADKAIEEWRLATQIDVPAKATEWAIGRVRKSPERLIERKEDAAEPAGYQKWNLKDKEAVQINAPPEAECAWAADGRTRCDDTPYMR